VKEQLKGIRLTEREAAEVVKELADHLEEAYRSSLGRGLTDRAAAQKAFEEVGNWRELQRKIASARKKELQMNKRVSQFWFPSFLTILLAMVFLMAIETLGPRPWISQTQPLHVTPVAVVYFAWMIMLPFIGALGAWLSARAGARPRVVFASII